jgi:phosphomannomutase
MMLVEMLATTGKRMSGLLKEIEKRYGASFYLRTDFRNPGIPKKDFVRIVREAAPSKIAGSKVKAIKDYDGIEFVLEDDSWLLLRPSGTEPVIRVYSESGSLERTKKIISWGNAAVKKLSAEARQK